MAIIANWRRYPPGFTVETMAAGDPFNAVEQSYSFAPVSTEPMVRLCVATPSLRVRVNEVFSGAESVHGLAVRSIPLRFRCLR